PASNYLGRQQGLEGTQGDAKERKTGPLVPLAVTARPCPAALNHFRKWGAARHPIRGPLGHFVVQAHPSAIQLLNVPQLEPMTTIRRGKETLPFTRDQRIEDEPELIHQSGRDQARGRPRTAHEVDGLAALPLECGDLVEPADKGGIWPLSRAQRA